MTRFESFLMATRLRKVILDRYDVPLFSSHLQAFGKAGSALEIGCGPGFSAAAILRRVDLDSLDLVDNSSELLGAARKNLSSDGFSKGTMLKYWNCSVENLIFPEHYFDLVFAFAVFHHVNDFERGLDEVARVLKPDGLFIVQEVLRGVHFWPISVLMKAPSMFSHENFLSCLEQRFRSVEVVKKVPFVYSYFVCKH